MSLPVLELSEISKDYRGLRPLRVHELALRAGEDVAVLGLDQTTAEVFINLITGTTLPDRGEIRVQGQSTASLRDSAGWLEFVDRFGIVSERAVLLDGMTVLQNLAMPFSLDVEPLGDALREQAVQLARDVGLKNDEWDRRAGDLDAAARLRVRLGRALAMNPVVVLFEHPSVGLPRQDVDAVGRDLRRQLESRRARGKAGPASLTLTADPELANALATRVLSLDRHPDVSRLDGAAGFRRP